MASHITKPRLFLRERQDGLCFNCLAPLAHKTGTYEHVIPKALGGTNHFANLGLSHPKCNSRRGSPIPTPEDFAKLISIHGLMNVAAMLDWFLTHRPPVEEITQARLTLAELPFFRFGNAAPPKEGLIEQLRNVETFSKRRPRKLFARALL